MKSGPFYGWVVVETAFAVLLMAYGAQFAFGIFFAALLEEFGWSRAGLSGAFALYVFLYSAFGLVSGRLTDLWGPRSPISSVRRAASWAFSSQWRAAWGALGAGFIYDRTGSYHLAWWPPRSTSWP